MTRSAIVLMAVLVCAVPAPAAARGAALPFRIDVPMLELGTTAPSSRVESAEAAKPLPVARDGATAHGDTRATRRRAGGWRSALPGAIR